jgi:hypothetical protein
MLGTSEEPASSGEQRGEGGDQRPVGPGAARPFHLTAQYRDFVAQQQDLGGLGSVATGPR